jgi:hypothetical protein
MSRTTINRLIINSPYEEPQRHWRYDRQTRTFELVAGRRPAGYVVASGDSRAFDDPGIFVEIPLVNQIRPRVKAWREAGYPGVTEHHQAAAGALAYNPRSSDDTAFLLLPVGGGRDADLAHRSASPPSGWASRFPATAARSCGGAAKWPPAQARPSSWRWRSPGISSTRWHQPAGRSLFEKRAGHRAGTDREEAPDCAGTSGRRATTTRRSTLCPLACWTSCGRAKVLIRNWHALAWES